MTGIIFNLGQNQGLGINAPTYGNNEFWMPKWEIPTVDLPDFPIGLTPSLFNELAVNISSLTLSGGAYGSGNFPDPPPSPLAFPNTNDVEHKVAAVFYPFGSNFGGFSFSGSSGTSEVVVGFHAYWNPGDGLFYPRFIYSYIDTMLGGTASTSATGSPVGTVTFLGKSIPINIDTGSPPANNATITVNTRF